MGIDLKRIWCMNRWSKKKNTKEQVAKGLWWAVADPQIEKYNYIWRSDIQLVALGILHIPLSPLGFLFDHQRTRLKHGFRGAECTIFKGASYKLASLMSQMETTQFLAQLPKHEQKAVERLWSCFPYRRTHRDRPFRFGRYRTNLTYQLDTQILCNRSNLPMVVQDIVGILTMTSHIGSKPLEDNVPNIPSDPASNTFTSLTSDSFLDLLMYCMADPSRAQSFSIEVGVDADVVTVSCDGSKTLQASMIFKEVFGDTSFSYPSDRARHQNFVEFVLAALKALLRCVTFETAVDSNRLFNILEKMTDVVNVSAESRPPPLDHTGYVNIPERSSSGETGYTSLLASSEVESDDSSAIKSQPEHGDEREADEDSTQSDGELDPAVQLDQSKEKLRLMEQIRDLQQELNEMEVKVAQKELKRLTQAWVDRAEEQ